MIKLPLALAFAGMLAASPALADNATSPIVGTWRMTTLEVPSESGQLAAIPYSGQVIFSEAGTLSVQAMNPDAKAPDNPYTVGGYEAYYGPVAVDDASKTFVITVQSAAVRGLIGQKFERAFEVTGDQLVLKPTNPEEGWRVTYKRD